MTRLCSPNPCWNGLAQSSAHSWCKIHNKTALSYTVPWDCSLLYRLVLTGRRVFLFFWWLLSLDHFNCPIPWATSGSVMNNRLLSVKLLPHLTYHIPSHLCRVPPVGVPYVVLVSTTLCRSAGWSCAPAAVVCSLQTVGSAHSRMVEADWNWSHSQPSWLKGCLNRTVEGPKHWP